MASTDHPEAPQRDTLRVQLSVVLRVDTDAWQAWAGEYPDHGTAAEWLAELVEVSQGRAAGAAQLERITVMRGFR